jgi:GT2 family glycosyltransferase
MPDLSPIDRIVTDGDRPAPGARGRDVSVIICAYTLERWELLSASIESVLRQSVRPRELFLSIDHNPELLERCRERWGGPHPDGAVPITVVANRYDGHLGSARTTAAELATGEFIAFLDDDAAAEVDWLERMLTPFDQPGVIAVGGCPLPEFSVPRPRWFPPEYDWVFGCSYVGLPTTTAPVLHVIGAAMSVRRSDLAAIGYFHSDNHDDMDMCHRLLHHSPDSRILFEPTAVVRHYVHPNRLTWKYFWRRCFSVNRGKVKAFRDMGGARNLQAERRFARRSLTEGLTRGARELLGGDLGGASRSVVICIGLFLAGSGYAVGSIEWTLHERRHPGRSLAASTSTEEAAPPDP